MHHPSRRHERQLTAGNGGTGPLVHHPERVLSYWEPVMLVFVYLMLFLGVSAALTWWRVSNYRHFHEG
jgi:hypothetical protein